MKLYTASLGNGTSNCRYGHMFFVGSRVFNDTISTALTVISLDEKYVRMSATWLNLI